LHIDRHEKTFEYNRCTIFQGANYDTEHYLEVAKVRERLVVSKQEAQKFDVERFNLRQLSEMEVRKQYHIKMSKESCSFGELK
jgi:hypothetical protein